MAKVIYNKDQVLEHAHIEYSSNIINDKRILKTSTKDTYYIDAKNLDLVVSIKYDFIDNHWILYCSNKNTYDNITNNNILIKTINDLENTLNCSDIYIAIILGDKLHILSSKNYNKDSYILHQSIDYPCRIKITDTIIYYSNDIVLIPITKISDIIIFTRDGPVYLNPTSVEKLIIKLMFDFNSRKKLTDYLNSNIKNDILAENIFLFLNNLMVSLSETPNPTYNCIHNEMSNNDKEYYSKCLKKFSYSVKNIFYKTVQFIEYNKLNNELIDFISEIIWKLRKEFIYELYLFNGYLTKLKKERLNITNISDNNYFYLDYYIHNKYKSESKNKITPILLENIICDFFSLNTKISIIMPSLKNRSDVFEWFHNYENDSSINRKYKYPFKFFSVYLFIFEHLLNVD